MGVIRLHPSRRPRYKNFSSTVSALKHLGKSVPVVSGKAGFHSKLAAENDDRISLNRLP